VVRRRALFSIAQAKTSRNQPRQSDIRQSRAALGHHVLCLSRRAMMRRMPAKRALSPAQPSFDLEVFLDAVNVATRTTKYRKSERIFSQGDPAEDVFYLQQGSVKMAVLSRAGKEAVVAILAPGDFFGEGCLAGQPRRMASASALAASRVIVLEKHVMHDLLRRHPSLSERFLSHMLTRNIRIEEDLIDQLFNSSEKRLARALLLLARYGEAGQPLRVPKLSQETLAEMVGTTRSRVNFFMNKFRDLGFIEYNGEIKVNPALLTVVLHE
jgi:CRP-like cAMP-binding protein